MKETSRIRGLSDKAFPALYGRKYPCLAALIRLRWPEGLVCGSCGHRGCFVLGRRRGLCQCNHFKTQLSVTAGTIVRSTKLPVTVWFAAIHQVVMARRESDTRLDGRVEMDDGYLGAACSDALRCLTALDGLARSRMATFISPLAEHPRAFSVGKQFLPKAEDSMSEIAGVW